MTQQIKPFGSWKSPITPELLVQQSVRLGRPQSVGPDTWWTELRPAEKGRTVLVRCAADGTQTDVTPEGFSVRSRVHEYGGGSCLVVEQTAYFVNDKDQRLYVIEPDSEPRALTPAGDKRYADFVYDHAHDRLFAVEEQHGESEPENRLVSIPADGSGDPQTVAEGADFYSTPRISPDGSRLCWLSWDHPQMPWDGTILSCATIGTDGEIGTPQRVSGGVAESVFQPCFAPDGKLYFVSDRSGWWNIYREQNGGSEPVMAMEAEFGMPQWIFGMSTFVPLSNNRLIAAYTRDGCWHLARIDLNSGKLERLDLPYRSVSYINGNDERVTFLGGAPDRPDAIVELRLDSGETRELKRSNSLSFEPGVLSDPQHISFDNRQGDRVYAFYYPPANPEFRAPDGEKPPVIVKSHGGPTASAYASLSLKNQFWTSRGFAVLDVNYGGSTGYGRPYRERLDGQWGILDVADCVDAAKSLAERGLADSERLVITGSSAGGYTTLCAVTFHDVFKAGASYYGISDVRSLASDTHKFESRYDQRLLGAESPDSPVYAERSPINFVEQLNCPLIFFQGSEDRVVPPSQAERMVEALKEKGLFVEYHLFEGESHGFRRAESLKTAVERELSFYARVFGFPMAE